MRSVKRVHLGHLLAVCSEAAEAAGGHVREVWRSGGGEESVARNKDREGGFDPCTAADLRAQATIFNHILAVWPEMEVVGEEEAEEVVKEKGSLAESKTLKDVEERMERRGKNSLSSALFDAANAHADLRDLELSRIKIFVDPLDGTTEYTKGRLEAVTSLIGITYDGRPIAGIIHQPFADSGLSLPRNLLSERVSDEEERQARQLLLHRAQSGHTVAAIVGTGVFGLEDVPILHRRRGGADDLVVTTTRSHACPEVLQYLRRLNVDKIERMGGSGYKALRVASGLADVFTLPNPHTSLWDTCAPEALMVAQGGKLTDCHGDLIDYSRPLTSLLDAKNTSGILAAIDFDHHTRVLDSLDFSRDLGEDDN